MSCVIVQEACSVEIINLSLNNFGNKGAEYLLEALEQSESNIKSLSISGCGLTETSVFGRMLCRNETIEKLDISNNRIIEVSIPTGI